MITASITLLTFALSIVVYVRPRRDGGEAIERNLRIAAQIEGSDPEMASVMRRHAIEKARKNFLRETWQGYEAVARHNEKTAFARLDAGEGMFGGAMIVAFGVAFELGVMAYLSNPEHFAWHWAAVWRLAVAAAFAFGGLVMIVVGIRYAFRHRASARIDADFDAYREARALDERRRREPPELPALSLKVNEEAAARHAIEMQERGENRSSRVARHKRAMYE